MDIKNDYFGKNRLEDMVGEIIIEHDEDEDADRHLIDMALQLSQQNEINNRTKYDTNSQNNLTDAIKKTWTPTFSIFPIPHAKILHHPLQHFNALYTINCIAFPDDSPSMQ